MDFKQLRTFSAAARLGSFSEAAHQLGYVQSAITNQIRTLESQLGTQLFSRNGRGVELTPAGATLLEYADRLFTLRQEAQDAVKQGSQLSGEVTLAGYETLLTYRMPAVLDRFLRDHPQIRLNVQPLSVKLLKTQVLSGQVDIALLLEESFELKGLTSRHLGEEEVVVIAAPNHPLASQVRVTAADLAGENLLLTEPGCSYRNRFERALIRAGAYNGNRMEFTSIEAIKSCARLGTGIGAISRISVEGELSRGELVALDWEGESLNSGFYVGWNERRRLTPAAELLLEYLKPQR
ncbi:LysR family transcriptional regulator [Ferrimonas futtsuensis]|uniref:LysR family transcriptional regulator n=1 Tax=Ferrimonas futtsuensis TaxID=364764 RepID=UPI000408D1AE|nr:LysR family transcriptional regulator [Ferrimonas futtsuensis]